MVCCCQYCLYACSLHLATFNNIAVSLVPANTSSSVLARELVPAHFDGRETYARGLLDPTEDTRLVSSLFTDFVLMLCKWLTAKRGS